MCFQGNGSWIRAVSQDFVDEFLCPIQIPSEFPPHGGGKFIEDLDADDTAFRE